MSRREVQALLADDLKRVEKAIGTDTICSVEAVTAISHHLQKSGGKRLRPALLLLASGACGYSGDAAIRLGAVVEIIHTATLVHDDVIDEADVRRGKPSINLRWGNQTSVLAGDWLYMQAFNLALRERNFYVLDLLIELTQMMVEGELMQLEWLGRLDVTEDEHLSLVHRKTAYLFSVCARLGAILAGADPKDEQRLGDYGWNLGMAFQLADDLLDFTASERVLGKPVGSDLREGKVTLSMILALKQCTPAERESVRRVITEQSYDAAPFRSVLGLLDKYGTIERVRVRALDYIENATAQLVSLPESNYKRALYSVTEWVVDRES
ncbi:MAG TPA: polyprenyl synthetase family protein [Bryobacterales bacterium]|nr:polyprenyl synthetase family protein [Bryobacterales bacterium]